MFSREYTIHAKITPVQLRVICTVDASCYTLIEKKVFNETNEDDSFKCFTGNHVSNTKPILVYVEDIIKKTILTKDNSYYSRSRCPVKLTAVGSR